MVREKRFSADRLAAAVAANMSPERVSLYGPPVEEVLAGLLKRARTPRHRRSQRCARNPDDSIVKAL
jgi:hypothetical protein